MIFKIMIGRVHGRLCSSRTRRTRSTLSRVRRERRQAGHRSTMRPRWLA